MGADLFITAVRAPRYTDGDLVELADLPAVTAARIADYHTDAGTVRRIADTLDLNEDRVLIVQIRELLTDAVAQIARNGRDELTTLTLDGTVWLLTGGLSWGDEPTEVYDAVNLIDLAGLFEAPFPR